MTAEKTKKKKLPILSRRKLKLVLMEAPKEPENRIPKKTGSAGTSRNTAILMLCMGIAAFLWLLIKLSDTYTWRVPVTLVYSNLPEDKVAVRELPDESEILVNTTGFKLLLAKFKIINITLPISYRENLSRPYLLASNLQDELAGEMPPGYQLLGFAPDTLYMQFDTKTSKKVPVVLAGNISYAKQYEGRSIPAVVPDSIEVTGPKSIMDTLTVWYTQPLSLTDLKESKEGNIALLQPQYSSVTLGAKEVRYSVEVESYTQITREVDIVLVNVPRNKQITPYPKKVQVTMHVGLSHLDAAKSATIKAVADFENVNLKKDRFVGVELTGYPDFIKISGFEPRNIEFIVYN